MACCAFMWGSPDLQMVTMPLSTIDCSGKHQRPLPSWVCTGAWGKIGLAMLVSRHLLEAGAFVPSRHWLDECFKLSCFCELQTWRTLKSCHAAIRGYATHSHHNLPHAAVSCAQPSHSANPNRDHHHLGPSLTLSYPMILHNTSVPKLLYGIA